MKSCRRTRKDELVGVMVSHGDKVVEEKRVLELFLMWVIGKSKEKTCQWFFGVGSKMFELGVLFIFWVLDFFFFLSVLLIRHVLK